MSTLYINRKTKRSCVTIAEFVESEFTSAKARRKAAAEARCRLEKLDGSKSVQYLISLKADSSWLNREGLAA